MDDINKLNEIFLKKFTEHKFRKIKNFEMTYVSIDQIMSRLNEMTEIGYRWDFENVSYEIIDHKNESGSRYDKSIDKVLSYVIVKGTLMIRDYDNNIVMRRDGVGADKWLYYDSTYGGLQDDLDKGIKTAYAEALKKSAYTTGIALYLWDEDERKMIEDDRNIPDSSTSGESSNKSEPTVRFTSEQKRNMKKVYSVFKIEKDNELDKYVSFWAKSKNYEYKSYNDIVPSNINDFCEYILEHGNEMIPFDS